MAEKKQISKVLKNKQLIEQLWLHHFNQILFEKGIITNEEYDHMKAKINCRNPSAS